MAEQDLTTPESVPDPPEQIVLSWDEWIEIEDSVIALSAAVRCGAGEGEEAELLVAVLKRFESALRPIRGRCDPES